jgi:hypothetical protein
MVRNCFFAFDIHAVAIFDIHTGAVGESDLSETHLISKIPEGKR